MSFVLTFVASQDWITNLHLRDALAAIGIDHTPRWLEQGKAATLNTDRLPDRARIDLLQAALAPLRVDVFMTPSSNQRKKLLVADMDATIVTAETLDELASHAGLHDRIAAITDRAMRGEIDFAAALRERIALLEGLEESALHDTLSQVKLTDGAEILVRTMTAHGATCVLVSGGFTFFTSAIAGRTGFHYHHGNLLELAGGRLTGRILEPVLDKAAKRNLLQSHAHNLKLTKDETLAIGDGANDLPMLEEAGLGIGFHPKKLVKEKIHNCILHGDLTAALYAQGYSSADFFTVR